MSFGANALQTYIQGKQIALREKELELRKIAIEKGILPPETRTVDAAPRPSAAPAGLPGGSPTAAPAQVTREQAEEIIVNHLKKTLAGMFQRADQFDVENMVDFVCVQFPTVLGMIKSATPDQALAFLKSDPVLAVIGNDAGGRGRKLVERLIAEANKPPDNMPN